MFTTDFVLTNTEEGISTLVHGTITELDDLTGEPKIIGNLQGEIIRLSEMINREITIPDDLTEWCYWVHSPAAEEICEYLTKDRTEFSWINKRVAKVLGEELPDSIHFIESIEIDIKHRGQNCGLKLFYDYIKAVASISMRALVVCHPAPIEFVSDKKHLYGKKKLRKYWQKLGMKSLPNSEYYGIVTGRINHWQEVKVNVK